jgi:hypothetical protein
VDEVISNTLEVVEFKIFCEILKAQVNEGTRGKKVDWVPIIATVACPLELGTPRKVKFVVENLAESLKALDWTDISLRGSTSEEEHADPALNDSLRTNQMAVNLKLTRMSVEAKGLISHEATLESLGSQIHDTIVQVGRDPGNLTSEK